MLFLLQQIQKNGSLRPHQDAESIKTSVSNVLAACQQYMKSREVSFMLYVMTLFKSKILYFIG